MRDLRFQQLEREIEREEREERALTAVPLRPRLEAHAADMRQRQADLKARAGSRKELNFAQGVLAELARVYETDLSTILHRHLCAPIRWLAFHVLHESGWSMAAIGRQFQMHHTTVRYGLQQLPPHLEENPELQMLIDGLKTISCKRSKRGFPLPRLPFSSPLPPSAGIETCNSDSHTCPVAGGLPKIHS